MLWVYVVDVLLAMAAGLAVAAFMHWVAHARPLVMILTALVCAGAGLWIALVLIPPTPLLTVPDMVGNYQDQVKVELERLGFKFEEQTNYSDEVAARKTMWQDPHAGSLVSRETTIVIGVSLGPEPQVIVPNVIGLEWAEAVRLLKSDHLQWDFNESVSHTSTNGTVLRQKPRPGSEVKRDTQVNLTRSAGPPESSVSVTFSDLNSNDEIELSRSPEGVFRFTVKGHTSGVAGSAGLKVLLWVHPVDPPAPANWYLQQKPNGITMDSDGNWRGRGQLGNKEWPPQTGHTFDLAITVVDAKTFAGLVQSGGEVSHDDPESISITTGVVTDLSAQL